MFKKVGGFAVKYRFWVVAAWIIAAVALFLFAPSLAEVGSMDESAFLPADSESLEARQIIAEYFPESVSGSTVSLIFFDENGLQDNDMTYAREVGDWLASGEPPFVVDTVTSVFNNPQLAGRLVSPDNTTMLLNLGIEKTAYDSGATDIVKAIREHLDDSPADLDVYVSGQVAIYADLNESLLKSIDLTTIATVVLIIVLLLAIYRSPLAALVPLLTIGVSFLVSRGIIGLIAEAGVSLWSQLDIFLIVLVFGVGTDYCLFLISRYREELTRYDSRAEAMKHTVGRIGEVIAASAFAVIVGLAGMAVARYQMIQTMGPTMGLSIFVTLLAAVTLTPALASVFGKALFWPRHAIVRQDGGPKESGFWYRIGRIAADKPIWTGLVLIIVLLVPYISLPGLNRSYDQMAEIPQDSESVQGFRVLEEHYDIGEMDPLTGIIVADGDTGLTGPAALAAVSALTTDLLNTDGVVKVQSIVQPEGTGETPAELTVAGQLGLIGQQIASNFNEDSDPAVLLDESVDVAFLQVTSYLDELEADFPWVAEDETYTGLRSVVTEIEQTIGEIRTGALVETQLNMLAGQVLQVSENPTGTDGFPTGETAGLVLLSKGYLDELAAAYPSVTDDPAYVSADGIASGIAMALASSMPPEYLPATVQALMADLPGSLDRLGANLVELAAGYAGTGTVLFSETLAQVEHNPSALDILEQDLGVLNQNIAGLTESFMSQGNPVFLSSVLLASSEDAAMLLDAFYSADRQAMRFYIVLDAYPQSERAMDTVKAVRATMQTSLDDSVLDGSHRVIGGSSAEITDVQTVLNEDFNTIMIVVIAAIFIVLALLLRSLIAPVYLLLTVLLSYGSTLGIVSWLFQDILGHDGISFIVPIIVFVLLVALGSDYNIFLMSRVREEAGTHPPHLAARLAVMATGGVITACGLILAGTFGVLVITPIRTMVHIGAAVSIGVFLDTFLVRALLVPAIASLLGRWNWWPRKYGQH